MDGTTLCPHCQTRFKITAVQIEAHQGMVRCGHCLEVFDARLSFIAEAAYPQLELDISPVAPEPATVAPEVLPTPASVLAEAAHEDLDFSVATVPAEAEVAPLLVPEPFDEAAVILAEAVEATKQESSTARSSRRWLWLTGILLLLGVLCLQAVYFFRVDLAARVPSIKPALLTSCVWLGCEVPLPRTTELMSIESSSLEADPAHASHITLHALLRNRAPYALAFPDLELTLNDRSDSPVARRIFKPADYLPVAMHETSGLAANQELGVKLLLDTSDLDPNGYRLAVIYTVKR